MSFTATVNLSTLDGTTGFRLDGISVSDNGGRSVAAAGDVRGDGFADLIIGANGADPNSRTDAGSNHIHFSPAIGGTTYRGTTLAGSLRGAAVDGGMNDYGGNKTVSAGVGDDAIDGEAAVGTAADRGDQATERAAGCVASGPGGVSAEETCVAAIRRAVTAKRSTNLGK